LTNFNPYDILNISSEREVNNMEVNCKNILENNEDLTIHGEGLNDGDTFAFKDEPTTIYMIADGLSQIFNIETGETFTLQRKDYEKPINIVNTKIRGDNMLKKGTRVKIVDKHLKSRYICRIKFTRLL
jgi:hypothetical protein